MRAMWIMQLSISFMCCLFFVLLTLTEAKLSCSMPNYPTIASKTCPFKGQSAEELNMTFYIFRKEKPTITEAFIWNNKTTYNIDFSGQEIQEIVILVSGYTVTVTEYPDFYEMRDELFKIQNVSCVIFASWTNSSVQDYFKAAANVIVAGEILADFCVYTNISSEKLHIVGHSLGAHIAGYAGSNLKRINRTVKRCTGLDPAGPCFATNKYYNRLSTGDCGFVDVIHTDAYIYGDPRQFGCSDYNPNGGAHQVGCPPITDRYQYYNNITNITSSRVCSHSRALFLFTESIDSLCPFVGAICSCWDRFEDNKCVSTDPSIPSNFSVMGYHATPPANKTDVDHVNCKEGKCGRYYLYTSATHGSYCVYQYIVTIDVAKKSSNGTKCKTTCGYLILEDKDKSGVNLTIHEEADNTKDICLTPGKSNTFISYSASPFNYTEDIYVTLSNSDKKSKSICISSITVLPISLTDTKPKKYITKGPMETSVACGFVLV